MQKELIELLERLVLHSTDFAKNQHLQNLLIWTAIKIEPSRVMDYINRLDNYKAEELAKICLGQEYKLYNEAFEIYKKAEMNEQAIDVLLNNIEGIERAVDFANELGNDPVVWGKLGKAQLDAQLTENCIESFLKADNSEHSLQVIQLAERDEKYEKLVDYLLMARSHQVA